MGRIRTDHTPADKTFFNILANNLFEQRRNTLRKAVSGGAAARSCCDPARGRRGRDQDTSVRQYPSGCAVRSAALTGCRTGNPPADTSQ